MLDTDTKRRIDTARDILVGKVPDPKSQVEQITIALIYKFMDDMDAESEEMGGKRKFFAREFARYGWAKLMQPGLGGHEMLNLYAEGITKMPENPGIPPLFRDIFKNAYLPYRDPETLKSFLKIINEFTYDHSERLGDAFEYLLSVLGSQGDAGQFRTPRHIIDFIVEVIDPKKDESVLDPACGTAGFLIASYKHILRGNTSKPSPQPSPIGRGSEHFRGGFDFAGLKERARQLRKNQTDAEALLWELLRDRQLDNAKFRRQHQFGDYICDFYCHEAQLVVECDGDVHRTAERKKIDQKRDAYLGSQGLVVIRFQNEQVLTDPESVLEEIANHLIPPSPAGRGGGGEGGRRPGDLLTPDEKGGLAKNFKGYDISPDMVRLSLVNMYLHGFADPHIVEYDTLTSQDRWGEYADVILANPPFMSPKGGIKPHNRFSVQSKRSEVLFVDYMAEHLTPKGRAGIIVPEGIIFQSQNAYKQLRKKLVKNNLVAVVSLPAGVFNPYSGVKTSILILDNSLARRSNTIAFFKIANDGYNLGAQRRPIDKNDLPQAQAELAEYLRRLRVKEPVLPLPPGEGRGEGFPLTHGLVVSKEKIAANGDYNLSGERYREAPSNNHTFPLTRIGDVCTVNPRKSQLVEQKPGTHVSFVPMADLNEHRMSFQPGGEKLLSEVSASYTYFEDNDVLLAKVTPCFENGKAGIARGLLNGIGFGSSEFYVLRSNGQVRPEWLYFCVTHPVFRDTAIAQMTGTGGLQRVPRDYVESFQIPLPPLEVQKEIVAEIEGYQKVIDGARVVLDNYRPHIPIHPDWPMVQLGELCTDFQNGANFSKEQMGRGTRFVNIKDLFSPGYVDWTKLERVELSDIEIERKKLKLDDLLFVRSSVKEEGVGFPSLMTDCNEAVVFCGFIIKCSPKKEVALPAYLLHLLRTPEFRGKVVGLSNRANITNISQDSLKSLLIPLPPLVTQQAIVAEIEAEQALVAANRELITRFEQKIQATLARIWGEPISLESDSPRKVS